MKSNYSKGRASERNLVEKLWELNYVAVRVPGSGRCYKRPHPDITASNELRNLSIQVKTSKSKTVMYIEKSSLDDVIKFSKIAGTEPLLACKFKQDSEFYVYTANTVTEKGTTYKVEKKNGIPIEQYLSAQPIKTEELYSLRHELFEIAEALGLTENENISLYESGEFLLGLTIALKPTVEFLNLKKFVAECLIRNALNVHINAFGSFLAVEVSFLKFNR